MWKCEALNIDGRKGVTMVAVKTLKESASNKEKEDLVAEARNFYFNFCFYLTFILCTVESDEDAAY